MTLDALLRSEAMDAKFRTYLRFADATVEDARYISSLRADAKLSRYLSRPPQDVEAQLAWLSSYKRREAEGLELYFVIMSDGANSGVVRMYDFRSIEGKRSFCWGSWIIPEPRAPGLVTYSAILVYELGFDVLGFEQSRFDVRKINAKVIAFHERAGARRVREDDTDVSFIFSPGDYRKFRDISREQMKRHRIPAHGVNSGETTKRSSEFRRAR